MLPAIRFVRGVKMICSIRPYKPFCDFKIFYFAVVAPANQISVKIFFLYIKRISFYLTFIDNIFFIHKIFLNRPYRKTGTSRNAIAAHYTFFTIYKSFPFAHSYCGRSASINTFTTAKTGALHNLEFFIIFL